MDLYTYLCIFTYNRPEMGLMCSTTCVWGGAAVYDAGSSLLPKVNPLPAAVTSVAELGKGSVFWDSVTETLSYALEQLSGGTRSLLAVPQR